MDQIFKTSTGVPKAMKSSIFSFTGTLRLLVMALALTLSTGCSVFGVRTAEEVPYTVSESHEDKEIRLYRPRIIAKITVTGEYKDSQRQAFRILADYIFGKNVEKQEIAMTAPVTQEPKSNKIAMTAPVTQEKAPGGWTLTFSMPAKYKTIAELPTPEDDRIELLERPGGLFAVIRYTWLTGQERNNEKVTLLMDWLRKNGEYKAISTPYYAGYDPPWTIPFLRRQEMLVEVKKIKSEGPN